MTSTLFNNFYIVDVKLRRQALLNHWRFHTAPKMLERRIKLQSNPENLISQCHSSFITRYSTTSKSKWLNCWSSMLSKIDMAHLFSKQLKIGRKIYLSQVVQF